MTDTLRPLYDRIVLELGPTKESKSKIVVPDKYKVPPNEGTVVAVGPGRYENGTLIPMSVKVGDYVLVQEGRGVDFAANGKVLRIMEEGGCMAIIERSTLTLQ